MLYIITFILVVILYIVVMIFTNQSHLKDGQILISQNQKHIINNIEAVVLKINSLNKSKNQLTEG